MEHFYEHAPILIVDRNDHSYEETLRALNYDSPPENSIIRFKEGDDAVDYLFLCGADANMDKYIPPALILLDINMHSPNSRSILLRIKSNAALKSTPIAVISTENFSSDMIACYALGANYYIKRSSNLNHFYTTIQKLKEYCLDVSACQE